MGSIGPTNDEEWERILAEEAEREAALRELEDAGQAVLARFLRFARTRVGISQDQFMEILRGPKL